MANNIQIGADTSGFVAGINRAQASMRGLGATIQTMQQTSGSSFLDNIIGANPGLAVLNFALEAIKFSAKEFYEALQFGGKLVDLARQTGVAVDKLMELQLAFEQIGMTGNDVQPVLAKLQRSISEAASGSVEAAQKFKMIGISMDEIKGLSADEQFLKVGDAINKIENPAQRAAMAMQLFEENGTKLLAIFAAGGLEDVRAALGTQSALLVENAGVFKRAANVLDTASVKVRGLFVGVASEIVPQIMGAVDALNSIDLAPIGQAFGNAVAFWINYFQNFGTTGDLIYNTLKLAFQSAINFFGENLRVNIATAAADIKNTFSGETVRNKAIQQAEIEARTKSPIIDTTETEARIQAASDAIEFSKQATAAAAREKYGTPMPGESGAGYIPKPMESGILGMPDISSLQRVGGGSALLSGGQDNSPAYQSVRIQEDIRTYIKQLIDVVKQGGQDYQIAPAQSGSMVLTA